MTGIGQNTCKLHQLKGKSPVLECSQKSFPVTVTWRDEGTGQGAHP